jgi:hypothetical protein
MGRVNNPAIEIRCDKAGARPPTSRIRSRTSVSRFQLRLSFCSTARVAAKYPSAEDLHSRGGATFGRLTQRRGLRGFEG